MKKGLKILILALGLTLTFNMGVKAESSTGTSDTQTYELDGKYKTSEADSFSSALKEEGVSDTSVADLSIVGGKATLEMDWNKFSELPEKEQEATLSVISEKGYYANIQQAETSNADSQNGFMNSVTTYGEGTALMSILFGNTRPNYSKAMEIVAPFNSPIGTILGVIVIGCSMALVLVMAFDICYMTIPWLQSKENDKKEGGGRSLVSKAARKAVEKADADGIGGAGMLWFWMKDRILLLVLFGACILYLIDGSIFKIIGWFLDLGSGL